MIQYVSWEGPHLGWHILVEQTTGSTATTVSHCFIQGKHGIGIPCCLSYSFVVHHNLILTLIQWHRRFILSWSNVISDVLFYIFILYIIHMNQHSCCFTSTAVLHGHLAYRRMYTRSQSWHPKYELLETCNNLSCCGRNESHNDQLSKLELDRSVCRNFIVSWGCSVLYFYKVEGGNGGKEWEWLAKQVTAEEETGRRFRWRPRKQWRHKFKYTSF